MAIFVLIGVLRGFPAAAAGRCTQTDDGKIACLFRFGHGFLCIDCNFGCFAGFFFFKGFFFAAGFFFLSAMTHLAQAVGSFEVMC